MSLKKRGRMLVASYEALRFQKLDLFSVMLRQIGNQIMRMHLEDAIDVIKTATATPTPRPHTRSATTPSAAPKAA